MFKMLTTQLTGLYQRILQTEEENIEDAARLLAQAGIGEGNVYFACFDEFQAIEDNAIIGAAPFKKLARWTPDVALTDADRICIFTRETTNIAAIELAQYCHDNFIPFAVVASDKASDDNVLSDLAYVYISLKVRGGLLPHPTNLAERVVMPHLLAGLFVYEALKLSYDEMVDDDDDLGEDNAPDDTPASPFA
ncbi:DUF2529 family protein [Caryophanon tenue]|uniref:DUF2529 domain-containing protein n=1 Tax=Caryophanon tenue TaxID=33978 RepID=A0A1C0Y878_9BACL|nr:DUF2529 family protein [Caryophanon tenue]OCS83333.1 hypothetical protein A6M13_04730 [Caryophanon tenue]